jgi:hypothetical protein
VQAAVSSTLATAARFDMPRKGCGRLARWPAGRGVLQLDSVFDMINRYPRSHSSACLPCSRW